MKSPHYLISKAHVYPQNRQISDPEDRHYNILLGAWCSGIDQNTILVKSSNPQRPRPQSKKNDIETGEDLKGE